MFSVLSTGVLLPMMHWTSTYRSHPSPRLRIWTCSNLPNFTLTVQEPHPSPPRDMGHVQTSLLWNTYSRQAGGWHPTGMLSCFIKLLMTSFSQKTEPVVKRVQVINYTERPMRSEFYCHKTLKNYAFRVSKNLCIQSLKIVYELINKHFKTVHYKTMVTSYKRTWRNCGCVRRWFRSKFYVHHQAFTV